MLNRRRLLMVVGGHAILAEVAMTPAEHRLGLSGRDHLDDDCGMVFVFSTPARHSFWMRGVPFGLSIAFIQDDGTIVALNDMTPMSDARVSSPEPVKLALEAPLGWFARRGIKPGDKVAIAGR